MPSQDPKSPQLEGDNDPDPFIRNEYRLARAREMGYNTDRPLYHLTKNDFNAFKLNADPTSHAGGHAIWLREDPRSNPAAHQVSDPRELYTSGARNIPVYVKHGKEVPSDVQWDLKQQGKLNGSFPIVVHKHENEMLRGMGYTHARTPGGEWAMLDPQPIRSTFARFDPSEANSDDIMKKTGGAINPEKAIRAANMIARRVGRAPGGSLSDAMNSFSKEREDSLKRPASGSTGSDAALLAMLRPHPQLAIAEPEDSRRRMAPSGQVADLGAQIDEGAHWLAGQSGDEPPVVSGVHQTAVKQGNAPALITTKSYSNGPVENMPPSGDGPSVASLASYIYRRAQDYGVNPNLALGIALREGLNNNTVAHGGNRDAGGWSYGPFQLFSGGLAPQFQKETGLDPRDPSTQYAQADWALKFMRNNPGEISNGSKTWFSIRDNGGIGNLASIGANYAARNGNFAQPTESADNSTAPAIQTNPRQVDAQGIGKVLNRDGSFTLTDQNGQTVGYDRGSAPLASVPQSQPHMQPAQVPAQTAPPAPTPQPQQQPQQQPPSDQLGQADPMSNMFDRMAFMPDVQAGYDSPQVLYDPNAAPQLSARGGTIKRASGGPAYASMPTNELIARALEIIRKHRDTGGSTNNGLPNNGALRVSGLTEHAPNGDILLNQDLPANYSRNNNTAAWEPPIEIPSSSPAPAAAQTPVANNPAVAAGTVGNAAGATGSPIGTIPMAAPTQPPPPDWNNTLDQALQTNNPTMNQIFGFNYPQNLPSPKPQPQGPVSQDEINALYGFGGGSQMGTGTFQSGGAIIMDALNRARRAKGNKRNV